MDFEKRYYAKLMIVGEYGVILDGEALTIPLKQFHASLARLEALEDQQNSEAHQAAVASINHLRNLAIYLQELPPNSFHAQSDPALLTQEVTRGTYIRSTVPEGYGIGSSGVVSAIVYDQFFSGKEDLNPEQLRKDLATIESYFHGKSSGVDALSCYLGKPLHFADGGRIEQPGFSPSRIPGSYRLFLVDSEAVFETGPLVQKFLEKMKEPAYASTIQQEFLPLNRKLIALLTGKSAGNPAMVFRAISDLQFREFREMIPDNIEDHWLYGQLSNSFYLKLNGSGGGFVLGICHENVTSEVEQHFTGKGLIWVG